MEQDIREWESQIASRVEAFQNELHLLRTNRPTAKLVEDIKIEYYDQPTPIKHLGTISINPPRDINVSIWDAQAVPLVAKAIQDAGLGVSVSVEGALVRVTLPVLTEERRKEIVKIVGKLAEETRIQIRRLREEMNKKIDTAEKEKKISEDHRFKDRERVQRTVDKANQEVEVSVLKKTEEIKE